MATLDPSRPAHPAGFTIGPALLAGLLALGFFLPGLGDVPFVDEYAYITQSYQPDLLLRGGREAEAAWLEFPGYDLVPLPKYLINGAYRLAGIARPRRHDALAWYANTSYRWGSTFELAVARLPSVLLGAIGCAAILTIGRRTWGPAAGWLAAGLLALNPLYRLHAHRAMSEAPCEALGLVALALAAWAWRTMLIRPGPRAALTGWAAMLAAGACAGLAILAKFNGILVLLVLAAWAALGLLLPGIAAGRKLSLAAASGAAALVAAATFIALNPTLTVHPQGPLPPELDALDRLGVAGRMRFLLDHRMELSRGQQAMFPHNALTTPAARAAVLAVQGFGRFGPFGPPHSDSTGRYDPTQDWGATIWLPVVLLSLAHAAYDGLRRVRRGDLPLPWLVLLWASLAILVVGAYLPMAWDRYLLPIQAPCALLGAGLLAGVVRRVRGPGLSPARP